jgi:hypothetical protein
MLCCVAMMTGLSYEAVKEAASHLCAEYDADLTPLTHGLMRQIAHAAGQALVTSIFVDWNYAAIVGVPSLLHPGFGHAVFWTGAHMIDPGSSGLYTLTYVQEKAVEFTQRARHLGALVLYDQQHSLQHAA